MQDLRRIITEEQRDIFLNALGIAINDTNNESIGYIGVIGSMPGHDIDVLMLKKSGSFIGQSLIEMFNIYKKIDEIVGTNHAALISPFPKVIMQDEVNYIISQHTGRNDIIPVHTLYFPDHESFIKRSPVHFLDSIKNRTLDFKGNLDFSDTDFSTPQELLDKYFFICDFQIPLIQDKYPKQLYQDKAAHLLSYLKRNYNIRTTKSDGHAINDILLELDRNCRN
jgi:hypothetical protein